MHSHNPQVRIQVLVDQFGNQYYADEFGRPIDPSTLPLPQIPNPYAIPQTYLSEESSDSSSSYDEEEVRRKQKQRKREKQKRQKKRKQQRALLDQFIVLYKDPTLILQIPQDEIPTWVIKIKKNMTVLGAMGEKLLAMFKDPDLIPPSSVGPIESSSDSADGIVYSVTSSSDSSDGIGPEYVVKPVPNKPKISEDIMIEYKITRDEFLRMQHGVDIVFLMDCTDSMHRWIEIARDTILSIPDKFMENRAYHQCILQFAFIAYRDTCDYNPLEIHPFTEDVEELKEWIGKLKAVGGGDIPEDISSGLDAALKLDWKAQTRILIHVADAPCHGRDYHELHYDVPQNHDEVDETRLGMIDNHPDGHPKFNIQELVLKLSQHTDYYFGRIIQEDGSCYTDIMTQKFDALYNQTGRRTFNILDLGLDPENFVPEVLRSMSQSIPKQKEATNPEDLIF